MESVIRYVAKHIDGYFLTIRCEPTDSLRSAARFANKEDLDTFMKGMYGPVDPLNFTYVEMKVTYELEGERNGTNSQGTT